MAYTKYSLTPADNNAAPPNGAPEGMLPSGVNDTMRDMMAQIRDVGDGIRGGTYTMTAPVITGGSINNTPIGATTATTATFTTATVAKVEDSQGGVLAPISSVMRNRIINGAMVIDQRNAGASVTANDSVFPLDRWKMEVTQSSKLTAQQNAGSVTPPVGFINYLGLTSSSAFSVGVDDYFCVDQIIEGYNLADLGWGTANAKTVTLSFWVRSSLTGTFGGTLSNSASNRSYPYTYTISSANTWEQKSITITGDTSGTWLTTNGVGLRLRFGLGAGATFSGTAGAWAGSTFTSATGATSVVGTSGATFYITGVQLERGTQATSFDYRQLTTELQLCQRYYSTGSSYLQTSGTAPGGVNLFSSALKVTMRTAPTAAVASTIAGTSTSINFITVDQLAFTGIPDVNGRVAGTWTASAEL